MRFTSITLPALKSELNIAHVALGSVSDVLQQTLLKQYRPAEFEAWKPIRQLSFLAGRAAVRIWQNQFIKDDFPVPRHLDGSPQWPKNWCGSIAHCRTEAVAVLHKNDPLSNMKLLKGIGIDVECAQGAAMLVGSADLLACQAEQAVVQKSGYDEIDSLLAIFSIKESIYKAIYPSIKRYVDFLEVEIIDIDSHGYWEVKMKPDLALHCDGRRSVTGYLWRSQNKCYSICVLL